MDTQKVIKGCGNQTELDSKYGQVVVKNNSWSLFRSPGVDSRGHTEQQSLADGSAGAEVAVQGSPEPPLGGWDRGPGSRSPLFGQYCFSCNKTAPDTEEELQ